MRPKIGKAKEDGMRELVGDCIENFGGIFNDATEMAQAVNNSDAISEQAFKELCNGRTGEHFTFGRHKNLMWSYDSILDTHYFYL